MTGPIAIRRATSHDTAAVRGVVLRALLETNAPDYPAAVIDRLVATLPDRIVAMLERWRTYVAVADGCVVGTDSLSGQAVNAVFVEPTWQGRGVGTRLMETIEAAASLLGVETLNLQSSVTAQAFYAKRGYELVAEGAHGEERTLLMAKTLSEPSSAGR